MKNNKCVIVALFLISICGEIFSQSDSLFHRTIGYGYNTFSIEYQIRGSGAFPIYYFFGFDDYSEAIMWENSGDYPHWVVKNFWTLQIGTRNSNQFITFGGGYPGIDANGFKPYYEYQLQNDRIVDFNIISVYDGNISRESYNIESNVDKIIISTRDISDGTMPPRFYIFSNTPREELLRIYLMNYLNGIDYILDKQWVERNRGISIKDTQGYSRINVIENEYSIENTNRILRNLTKRELSIFRNYMYARHNYAFRTATWNNFFIEYFSQNYNGTRTNDEVMTLMTEYEKTILNMVIEIENQK